MKNIIGKKIVLKEGQEFWYKFDDCVSGDTSQMDIVDLWHGRTGTVKYVNKKVAHILLDEIDVGNGPEKEEWIYMNNDDVEPRYPYFAEEKEMGIKIITKKCVDSSGEMGRKILAVKGLRRDELPGAYLKNENAVCVNGLNGIYFSHSYKSILRFNEFYSEEYFQDALKKVALAGDILHDVNKELKKLKELWNGEETFVI